MQAAVIRYKCVLHRRLQITPHRITMNYSYICVLFFVWLIIATSEFADGFGRIDDNQIIVHRRVGHTLVLFCPTHDSSAYRQIGSSIWRRAVRYHVVHQVLAINNQLITKDRRMSLAPDSTSFGSALVVTGLKISDSGIYECIVQEDPWLQYYTWKVTVSN